MPAAAAETGEVLDRGDNIAAPAAAAAAVTTPTAEELAAEALAAGTLATDGAAAAAAATAAAEEKARDPATGKFAKKETHDDARIPKERFDEAVGKERAAREAAEARAAAAEARTQRENQDADVAKFEAHVEALEKQHAKHTLDGDHEKAAGVMKQIRLAERQFANFQSDEKIALATSKAVEQGRMDTAIAGLEAKHPFFNPESEAFDQDLVDIVLAEQSRLIRVLNYPPSKALTSAAEKIVSKFVKADPKPGTKDEPKEDAKGLAAAKGASDRKADQVAKNLAAAKAQPGSMKDSGKDSDKGGETVLTTAGMTAEEINALPASTKAKLRGDFV